MIKKLSDTFKLHNGVEMPVVGFGTWEVQDGEIAVQSVVNALKAGYRHIDTAAAYGNEESVGQALRQSLVAREDVFITTKLWNEAHGYQAALDAFEVSMGKLGLDVLDLYLVHWPNPIKFRSSFETTVVETWHAMEEIYNAGKARAIGVSNFMPHHLDVLLKSAKIVPMVNQIRLYPGYTQNDVVAYCEQRDILLEAYSPLGRGEVLGAQEITAIAQKHGKTPAQVCLRWCLQRGFVPLPKSVTPARIEENTQLFDFELTETEMEELNNMMNMGGNGADPDKAPF